MDSKAASSASNLRRMRFTWEVTVASSSTTRAASMSCCRFLTWPGCRASACTIQNSVRVSPVRLEAVGVQAQLAPLKDAVWAGGVGQRPCAAEQRGDPRQQVRQADVLGEVVIRAQSQARDGVEIAVARGEENQRQPRRAGPQFAAQFEAALGFVAQADVD